MVKQLNSVEAFREFIHQYPLAVVHVMRDQCSVCHAVLPQIEDFDAIISQCAISCD